MKITFLKDEDWLKRFYKGVRHTQVAEVTEVFNCARCDHVHVALRNCAGEVIAVAAFDDEIVDMINAAFRESQERRRHV